MIGAATTAFECDITNITVTNSRFSQIVKLASTAKIQKVVTSVETSLMDTCSNLLPNWSWLTAISMIAAGPSFNRPATVSFLSLNATSLAWMRVLQR